MGTKKTNTDANKINTATAAAGATTTDTVEVLYQKMGDRWFAFSLIDNEVFVGSISQEVIDAAEAAGKTSVKVPVA